jgi:predicted Zn-dependent protease
LNQSGPRKCECGSELRFSRCCGLDTLVVPPPESTGDLVAGVERASQAYRKGEIRLAEQLCLDVLERAPDRPGALAILYQIRKAQGRQLAAEALIRRAVAFDPNNFWATNELALLLLEKGAT